MQIVPVKNLEYFRCAVCTKKYSDTLMQPYSLEYLIMQVVLNKYIKNELLNGQENYFKGMNLRKKWNELVYTFNYSDIYDANTIIKCLLKDPLYFKKMKRVNVEKIDLQKYCAYCHNPMCSECGWIRRQPKWKIQLRLCGHLSTCMQNY